jgi:hypothetical protein
MEALARLHANTGSASALATSVLVVRLHSGFSYDEGNELVVSPLAEQVTTRLTPSS